MSGKNYQRFLDLPAGELEILRDRAKELAKNPEARNNVAAQVELLEIRSKGQAFALPLSAVDGVIELTSLANVPRAPSFVRGLVSFRGEVLIGVELGGLMGGDSAGFSDLRRVVAVAAGGRRLGILAEKGLTVLLGDLQEFRRDSVGAHPFVTGTDDHFLSLLDPSRLIDFVFSQLAQP